MAERHPGLTLIIDHMGLTLEIAKERRIKPAIDEVVKLARYPNVSVKVSAAVNFTMEPYPFRDVTEHIKRCFDAYGPKGMKAEFDFDLHARKRIDYIGVTFRTRTVEEVRDILVKMRADLLDDVKAGRIRVPIDKTYPLSEARAGHEHMRANKHFGKILLVP